MQLHFAEVGGVHKMKVTTQPVPLRPERAEAPSPGRALKKSLHGLC